MEIVTLKPGEISVSAFYLWSINCGSPYNMTITFLVERGRLGKTARTEFCF